MYNFQGILLYLLGDIEKSASTSSFLEVEILVILLLLAIYPWEIYATISLYKMKTCPWDLALYFSWEVLLQCWKFLIFAFHRTLLCVCVCVIVLCILQSFFYMHVWSIIQIFWIRQIGPWRERSGFAYLRVPGYFLTHERHLHIFLKRKWFMCADISSDCVKCWNFYILFLKKIVWKL